MAVRSTHKRKRSASRADCSRSAPGTPGRRTASIYTWSEHARRALSDAIHAHPFNHACNVLLPHVDDTHPVVADIHRIYESAKNGAYFARIPLSLFLEPGFIAQYIRSGSLYALSTTRLDTQDTVCLDGRGMLILSLTKDTYQQLGLVGRPCRYAFGASGRMGDRKSGPVSRYIVELPLCDASFVPGKRGFERAKQCLHAWDTLRASMGSAQLIHDVPATWSMLLVWAPPEQPGKEPRICAPINYEPLVKAGALRNAPLEIAVDVCTDVWVPERLDASNDSRDSMWSSLHDALEWCGLAFWRSARIQTYDRCDPRVAIYAPPTLSKPSLFTHTGLQGLLPPALLTSILKCVWAHLEAGCIPWACVSVAGFSDTPISWVSKYPGLGLALGSTTALPSLENDGYKAAQRARKVRRKGHIRRGESEHGFFRTGENGWTMILSPRHDQITFVESVELDTHA